MKNKSRNYNVMSVETAELRTVEGGGVAMGILVGAAIYGVAADQYDRRTEPMKNALKGIDFDD